MIKYFNFSTFQLFNFNLQQKTMLYYIGKIYDYTFLRLLSSYVVLLSIGSFISAALTWFALPRLWHRLPHDHGKALTPGGMASKGKPTGAGLVISLCILPALVLVVPFSPSLRVFDEWAISWLALLPLYLIMLFGYLDDRAEKPWGQLKKGLLDALCCVFCAFVMSLDGMNNVWLPLTKREFVVPLWLYLPAATAILFISVNSLNCSDGVDGLAGSLGIMSLVSLSVLLYLVLGYRPVSEYLLLPHYAGAARWAVISTTIGAAYAAYLWYNASPSQVLMGDAGSRMLGLAIGIAVLATGNPLLIFVFAPVVFLDGGTGLVKLLLLRLFKRLGFDTTPPGMLPRENAPRQTFLVRKFHAVRFPLHDHCRKNKGWSNEQVLVRFVLVQLLLIPLLFAVFTKVR